MDSGLGSDPVSMSPEAHDGFDASDLFSAANMRNLAMSRTGKNGPIPHQSRITPDGCFWVITYSRRDNSRRLRVFRIGIAIIS
jgi:hypothetical protein